MDQIRVQRLRDYLLRNKRVEIDLDKLASVGANYLLYGTVPEIDGTWNAFELELWDQMRADIDES